MGLNKTKIEWCDYTWNPITGCSAISDGCKNCYAAALSKRFGWHWGSSIFHSDRINDPINTKVPSRIFVCSMSDIAHDTVWHGWIDIIAHVMRSANWHQYIVLTKRPDKMLYDKFPISTWIGVTIESQKYMHRWKTLCERWPTTKFASIEPMLTPVTFLEQAIQPDWVIAGPETGPNKRQFKDEWINSLSKESPVFFDKRKTGWSRREYPISGN